MQVPGCECCTGSRSSGGIAAVVRVSVEELGGCRGRARACQVCAAQRRHAIQWDQECSYRELACRAFRAGVWLSPVRRWHGACLELEPVQPQREPWPRAVQEVG